MSSYYTSGYDENLDYSYESIDRADECAWMTPSLQTAEAATCFKRPRDVPDGRGIDFSKPVSMRLEVQARDNVLEVQKRCNFVYIPGVLFNRKIVRE